MAYLLKNQDIKNNLNNINNSTEEETNNSAILNVTNDLIIKMQQLQKILIEKHSEKVNVEKPSQTEILLQQIQNAMESTIAQFPQSSNDVILPQNEPETEQSISAKWRIYTEMYQGRNESAVDYCKKKMKLGQELGLSFKETKREMIIGLWSNRLPIILYLKQHEIEEDLIRDIEDWEKIEYARSDIFKKFRNKNLL